jgi:hypothetical protein
MDGKKHLGFHIKTGERFWTFAGRCTTSPQLIHILGG